MVTDRTHVFTWLERRRGAWIVTQTAQWNPDLVLRVESSCQDVGEEAVPLMPPAWMYSPYVEQEPLPTSP
jgi:hypothetical protein